MRRPRVPGVPELAVACALALGPALTAFAANANVDAGDRPAAAKPSLADEVSHERIHAWLPLAPLPRPEPFDLSVATTPEGPVWSKWRTLAADLARDTEVLVACRDDMTTCPDEARRLVAIVDAARAKSGRALIGEVNRAVNLTIRPVTDLAQHGEEDRWSAPLTTLASGRGDCEDYAIVKYAALREAGVADEDLRLVIVRDQRTRGDHAVLTVRQDGRWLVLDNRHFNLVDASDVPNLVPLFALGADGVQTFAKADAPVRVAARSPAVR
jgi:predicted transglutaminase-like cysteine proteinase